MVLMGSRFNERRRDDDLQSVSGLPDLRTVPERRTAPDLPDIQNNVRDSGTTFFFGRSSSGENVDEKSAMQIATVYACVRLLADSVAQIPLHLYKWDGEDRSVKAREHPLYKILHRQANPEMTKFSFMEMLMVQLLLWGNAYAQIVRDGKNSVLGLYPLLPENVEIDRDESGKLYYIYHAYTNDVPGETNKDIYFRREEILHIPGLGFNGLVGFSPIAMMKNPLGSTISVEKYGSSFFRNNGQPIGVLQHPTTLKDPERLRQDWKRIYGGSENAHNVAILEEGMTYKPISLPPEDSQFLSTREFDVETICSIFRVPPHMVQFLKRSTFNNIEHQSIDFVVHTLDPWLIRIEEAIVKDVLLEDEQDIYYPKFNVDGLLRGAVEDRMRAYSIAIASGIITSNEARQKENLPPFPPEEGADHPIVNGSYVRLSDVGAAYGRNIPSQEQTQQSQPEEQSKPTKLANPDKEANPDDDEKQEQETEKANKKHTERKKQRKSERRGK